MGEPALNAFRGMAGGTMRVVTAATNELVTPQTYAEPRRCVVRGCPWRGTCPDHGMIAGNEVDVEMNKLLRMRPFGASRKRQRQPARYNASPAVKSKVVVTSLAERRENPPSGAQRSRIVHPDPFNYLRNQMSRPAGRPRSAGDATCGDLEDSQTDAPGLGVVEAEPVLPIPAKDADAVPSLKFRGPGLPTPTTLANILQAKFKSARSVAPPVRATRASSEQGHREDALPELPVTRRRGRRVSAATSTTPISNRRGLRRPIR